MEIAVIIILALAVAALGFVLLRAKERAAKEKFDMQAAFGAEKDQLRKETEQEKAGLQQALAAEQAKSAALRSQLDARLEAQKDFAEQHKKELEQMKEVFQNLSNRNSDEFKTKSALAIAELLKPVNEKFTEFAGVVKESQKENAERHVRLEQKITDLEGRSQAVGDEARNLANALTGYSKVQGDFGEMLLVDVLKNAGLTEGVHFRTQSVITDATGHEVKSEAGRTLIPDVIVFYPDDTAVIVDSKVSLKAYNEYMAATTVEDRIRWAKAHVASVKSHVEELRNKDYAGYIDEGRRKVDFNIMFIPIEGAFRLMLEEDPMLWQLAKDNKVLIVSQMTLIIVLNMIKMAWKQHEQEKNIADVYKTAEELMSQIKSWLEAFEKTGSYLDKATAAFSDAKKKLSDSNQSVVKKIDKLEKLGLAPKRSTAKLKTGSRLTAEPSVIPSSLRSDALPEPDYEDAQNEAEGEDSSLDIE